MSTVIYTVSGLQGLRRFRKEEKPKGKARPRHYNLHCKKYNVNCSGAGREQSQILHCPTREKFSQKKNYIFVHMTKVEKKNSFVFSLPYREWAPGT